MNYSVGQVAKLTGVTVRTLHHYDHIGLLHPRAQTAAGHRRYVRDDLERLQRILCYRQLGFSLDQIKAIIDDPTIDSLEHLRRQHAWLSDRLKAFHHMVTAVEKIMEARTMGIPLEPHEILEVFGENNLPLYHEEAEQHWGDTTAWSEVQQRVARYAKGDWQRMQAEATSLLAEVGAAQMAGRGPKSRSSMDLAEGHRQHLERWFYPCSYRMHCGLGDLYVNDSRFAAQLSTIVPDLAQFLREAIYANAARHISVSAGGH